MSEVSEVIVKEKPVVRTNFYYAGFFIRLLAFSIDMLVASSLANIIKNLVGNDFAITDSISLFTIIFWLITLAYFTLMTYFNHGQTLGKMVTDIRVISTKGEKLTWGQVVSRETFGRYVQNKLIILYLLIAFAPKKQSLMDMLTDTVVVKNNAYEYYLSTIKTL
ncbi:RDD family protein [Anaerococcus cruorum]|uniref:RDD family protein n=1 Tax=Anaerococcus sp. WGS1596 TaxID=3366806 RepID=UPI00372D2AED